MAKSLLPLIVPAVLALFILLQKKKEGMYVQPGTLVAGGEKHDWTQKSASFYKRFKLINKYKMVTTNEVAYLAPGTNWSGTLRAAWDLKYRVWVWVGTGNQDRYLPIPQNGDSRAWVWVQEGRPDVQAPPRGIEQPYVPKRA